MNRDPSRLTDIDDPRGTCTCGETRWVVKSIVMFVSTLVAILSMPRVAHPATIVVGHHEVTAKASTLIPISIQREDGDPDILGVELAIQIGDGSNGPEIGAVDLVSGTIFEKNNTGSRDKGSLPRQAFWETTTETGAVSIPESGLLATVEIDVGSLSSGSFDISLTSVMGSSTVLFDDMANAVAPNNGAEITGSVTIVPEPAGMLLYAGLGLVFVCGRMRVASLAC